MGVVLPVKSFALAKARLAPALDAAARAHLARTLAEVTLRAAHELPVAVVTSDPDVAAWARGAGAAVVEDPARGLDAAATAGVAHFEAEGADRIIVAHADLPLATDLRPVGDFPGITLVPDRRRDGTNVIAVPAGCGFVFSYGPRSFLRHQEAAARTKLRTRILEQPDLAWDVDEPSDLSVLSRSPAYCEAYGTGQSH